MNQYALIFRMTDTGSTGSPLEAAAGGVGPQVVEAFRRLSNETRLAILLALWEARTPWNGDDTMAFSALYERVGTGDTGGFNYHLDQLTPHFVERTEEGYGLTDSGFRVVQAIIAGTGFAEPTLGPVDVDKACPRCGSRMRTAYEENAVPYSCPSCGGVWDADDADDKPDSYVGGGVFPPAGLEGRDHDEVAEAFNAYALVRGLSMLFGVCPDCGGRIDTSLDLCEDHDASEGVCENCGGINLGQFEFACTVCKTSFGVAVRVPVVLHPAVASFFHRHDIRYFEESWDLIRTGFAGETELLSTDPVRVRITLVADDSELRVTLDDESRLVEMSESE